MADPKRVQVELSTLLQRLEPTALKGGISAPLALKAAHLAKLASNQEPVLGVVGPLELLSALLLRVAIDDPTIGQTVADYRRTKVWELRKALGQDTPEEGDWLVDVPGRGQQYT